jgi:hypothetical protein
VLLVTVLSGVRRLLNRLDDCGSDTDIECDPSCMLLRVASFTCPSAVSAVGPVQAVGPAAFPVLHFIIVGRAY